MTTPALAQSLMQKIEVSPGIVIEVERLAASPQATTDALPIYFVAGGPGVSPKQEVVRWSALFERWHQLGEVVSQRGSAQSSAALDCDTRWDLPLSRKVDRAEVIEDARRQLRQCAAKLRKAGGRLADDRTEAYAAAVLHVMRVLGYEAARVVAYSYGTMIAVELLRTAPSRIDHAVLAGVMGPAHALRDPRHHDRILLEAVQMVGINSEQFTLRWKRVSERVLRAGLKAQTLNGQTIVLSWAEVARGLLQLLGSAGSAGQAPRILEQIDDGTRDSGFELWKRSTADASLLMRRGPLARRVAAQHCLAVCANGSSVDEAQAQTRAGLFDWGLHEALPEACDAWGVGHHGSRAPVVSQQPVMLISGRLDVRTPHEQALAVQRGLKNAFLIDLAHAGHAEILGSDPWLLTRMGHFLRSEQLCGQSVEHRP